MKDNNIKTEGQIDRLGKQELNNPTLEKRYEPREHNKRVYWAIENKQEVSYQRNASIKKKKQKYQDKDQEGYKLGKSKWEKFVNENDYDGLIQYCKDIVNDSSSFTSIVKEYGKDSQEAISAEKKEISSLLSAYDCLMFKKVCTQRNIKFMKFLINNFTDYDLKRNIFNNNFTNFDLYLMSCKTWCKSKDYESEEFIEGIKQFFYVLDCSADALEHYIKRIAGYYYATNMMREDFVKALNNAKEEGIIKTLNISEIESIQNSYKEEENMTDFSFVARLQNTKYSNDLLNKNSTIQFRH